MLRNEMEIIVEQVLDEVQYDIMCSDKCREGNLKDKCKFNIKAEALNRLPPKYFPYETDPGTKAAFVVQRQNRITVLAKIAESVDIVCSSCNNNCQSKE